MKSETGTVLSELISKYVNDMMEVEKRNFRLENEINRMRSESKKAFAQLKEEKKNLELEKKQFHEEKQKLHKEIKSLEIGLMYRDEIINYIESKSKDKEILEYLKRVGKPGDF